MNIRFERKTSDVPAPDYPYFGELVDDEKYVVLFVAPGKGVVVSKNPAEEFQEPVGRFGADWSESCFNKIPATLAID